MDRGVLTSKAIVPATVAVAALVLFQLGVDNEGLRQALRATARFSLILFTLVYLAAPLHKLRPSSFSRWLMRNRTVIGLCFGLSISVHIALIVWLFADHRWVVPDGIGPADWLIGMPGLVIVLLMVITSAQTRRRAMTARSWALLHRTGLHLVWFIYTACLIDSFTLKSPPNPAWHYLPLIGLMLVMAGIRFLAWRTPHRAEGLAVIKERSV